VDEQLGKVILNQPDQRKLLLNLCPVCRKGKLETVAIFDQRGPSAHWQRKLKTA